MEPPFDIESLNWDDWNITHIRDRHGMSRGDVEAVLQSEASVAHATYKDRILELGPAPAGRALAVVIGADPDDSTAFYIFSARPASRKERRYYEEQQELMSDE
jgi:uncharacterized DUF497 family protein